MRILHVLYSLSAEGSPRLALGLLEQARTRGHDGVVLPLVAAPDDLRHEFAAAETHVLDPVGWRGRDYISLLIQMRRVLRAHRVDGVVCYTLGPHVAVALAARSLGIPVLVHIGNAPPDDPSARSKIKWQLRIGRRFVKMHVACSEYVRNRVMTDYGMPATSVVAILNGIDLPRFLDVRTRPRPHESALRFGMVGSFEVHKDQMTLIRALAAMAGDGNEARLELVGSGTKEPDLRALADELGVTHLIAWRGYVSDVREALERLDVFAYSVSSQEGLGIALVEALAAGIPCVGSDVGACKEVLKDGQLGKLLVPGDARAWAEAIVQASRDEAVPPVELVRFDIATTAESYEGLFTKGDAEWS
jgi:glycosyltransferase involved in cell wall biosynthesis